MRKHIILGIVAVALSAFVGGGLLLSPANSLAQNPTAQPDPIQQTIDAAVQQTLTAGTPSAQPTATNTPARPSPVVDRSLRLQEINAYSEHLGAVNALDYGPGGVLATGGADSLAFIIPQGEGITQRLLHETAVSDVLFTPDASELLTVDVNGRLYRWDVATGESLPLSDQRMTVTGDAPVGTVVFSGFNADGTQFATFTSSSAPRGGALTVWDYPAMTPAYNDTSAFDFALLDFGGQDEPATVAYTQTNRTDVIRFNALDSLNDTQPTSLDLRPDYVEPIAFSDDGARLLVIGNDTVTRIVDVTVPEVIATYPAQGIGLATFSPDGTLIADLGTDGSLYLLDAETGRTLASVSGHTGNVLDAAFTPNGQLIASAGEDGTVRVWRLVTAQTANATATPPPQTVNNAPTPLPEGCPQPVDSEVQVAEQVFQDGRMFWVQPVNQIWVMALSGQGRGQWFVYEDTFEEGEEVVIPQDLQPQEDGLYLPERGFGKLWVENADVREMLGYGTTPEFGYVSRYRYLPDAEVVDGECIPKPGQHILFSLDGEEFRFNEANGTWQLGG